MNKPFFPLDEDDRKSVVIHVRVTSNEADAISAGASARNLSRCEFIRRTALNRKTDLRFELEIIRELRIVARVISELHAAVNCAELKYVEINWEPVIQEIILTLQKLGN